MINDVAKLYPALADVNQLSLCLAGRGSLPVAHTWSDVHLKIISNGLSVRRKRLRAIEWLSKAGSLSPKLLGRKPKGYQGMADRSPKTSRAARLDTPDIACLHKARSGLD